MSSIVLDQTIRDKIEALIKPRSEKKLLRWNYSKNKVFVSAVQNTKAYKRTNQLGECKWQLVQKALYEDPAFEEDRSFLLKLSPDSLRVKFHKMCNDLKKTASISKEGANLSGLPDEVDEVSKILLNMMEELSQIDADRKNDCEKKRVKKAKLVEINNNVIAGMGVSPNSGKKKYN